MSGFNDREKAFENKMARDEEVEFRITARRNKLVGQWAAAKMNLTAEETDAYAKSVFLAVRSLFSIILALIMTVWMYCRIWKCAKALKPSLIGRPFRSFMLKANLLAVQTL